MLTRQVVFKFTHQINKLTAVRPDGTDEFYKKKSWLQSLTGSNQNVEIIQQKVCVSSIWIEFQQDI